MAILKTKDNSELIATCDCGCDNGLHIRIDLDSISGIPKEEETFCYATILSGNWYRDQGKTLRYIIKDKLKKIWAIIRNKDFYYSEVCMSREDFEVFREYIDEVENDRNR